MISGEDFIRFAGKLCVMPNAEEPACRTAVSRAYYGAFHLAKSLLDEMGFAPPRNANVHGFLQQHLIGCRHATAYRAGVLLSNLHSDRNRADYRFDDERWGTIAFAKLAVERAEEIRSLMTQCKIAPAKEEVEIAIAEYRDRIT